MGRVNERRRRGGWLAVAGLAVLATCVSVAAGAGEPDDAIQVMEGMANISRSFAGHCAVCHGEQLQGAAQGVALVGRELAGGSSTAEIEAGIARGSPERGMPAWSQALSATEIRGLAIYIAERRAGYREGQDEKAFRISDPIVIPDAAVASERQSFRVTVTSTGLDPLPSTMAFLPDGSLLLTEKHIGLTHIDRKGRRTLVAGTPRIRGRDDQVMLFGGMDVSNGWMLGVAVHPRYRTNGWIYLSWGELCDDCPRADPKNPLAPSMIKVARGRIRDGRWVDEQPIWSVAHEHYTQQTDTVAGGRMAFDDDGHLFIMVAMKNLDDGIQDLRRPWGKIHRVHDDGRIPADNPLVGRADALPSIWSYGHRNPQGIFFDERTRKLWSSEHGPRGGDEINQILPGRNYGWPLSSLGLNYDGTQVDGWSKYGVPYDPASIEQPVVEFTPSPGISALLICQGRRFPGWQGNFIVGSLKARELYRVVLEDGRPVHRETLLGDIGRIRDLQQGPDGNLYLLIEHPQGGQILRLAPAGRRPQNR